MDTTPALFQTVPDANPAEDVGSFAIIVPVPVEPSVIFTVPPAGRTSAVSSDPFKDAPDPQLTATPAAIWHP